MIRLTRVDGSPILVNPLQIEMAEADKDGEVMVYTPGRTTGVDVKESLETVERAWHAAMAELLARR